MCRRTCTTDASWDVHFACPGWHRYTPRNLVRRPIVQLPVPVSSRRNEVDPTGGPGTQGQRSTYLSAALHGGPAWICAPAWPQLVPVAICCRAGAVHDLEHRGSGTPKGAARRSCCQPAPSPRALGCRLPPVRRHQVTAATDDSSSLSDSAPNTDQGAQSLALDIDCECRVDADIEEAGRRECIDHLRARQPDVLVILAV